MLSVQSTDGSVHAGRIVTIQQRLPVHLFVALRVHADPHILDVMEKEVAPHRLRRCAVGFLAAHPQGQQQSPHGVRRNCNRSYAVERAKAGDRIR